MWLEIWWGGVELMFTFLILKSAKELKEIREYLLELLITSMIVDCAIMLIGTLIIANIFGVK